MIHEQDTADRDLAEIFALTEAEEREWEAHLAARNRSVLTTLELFEAFREYSEKGGEA